MQSIDLHPNYRRIFMPPRSDSLNDALDAIAQGRYAEAIEVLEMYEQLMYNPKSEQYVPVRQGLIEAYARTGNQKKAIWLCQQLVGHNNPEVQAWAKQKVESINKGELEPTKDSEVQSEPVPEKVLLAPEESENLLSTGTKAFKSGRYEQAVQALEQFCNGSDSHTKNYFWGQTYLVKAYQANNQTDKAIAFGEQMAKSEMEAVQIWGKKFLESVSANSSTPSPETQTETSGEKADNSETE
jgi:tetratricopeptide (TPR) repeat protein